MKFNGHSCGYIWQGRRGGLKKVWTAVFLVFWQCHGVTNRVSLLQHYCMHCLPDFRDPFGLRLCLFFFHKCSCLRSFYQYTISFIASVFKDMLATPLTNWFCKRFQRMVNPYDKNLLSPTCPRNAEVPFGPLHLLQVWNPQYTTQCHFHLGTETWVELYMCVSIIHPMT